MKTASELKRFFRDKFGIKTARVKTSAGLGQWQQVWIPSDRTQRELVFNETFPLAFRVACLKIIYPNSPSCWSGCAGNVMGHSISMHFREWDQVMMEWENQGLTALAPVVN